MICSIKETGISYKVNVRFEKVEFANMCMIYDKNKVVVMDSKKKDWYENQCRFVVLF